MRTQARFWFLHETLNPQPKNNISFFYYYIFVFCPVLFYMFIFPSYYLTISKFFTQVLSDVISLKSKWQHVSSDDQNFSIIVADFDSIVFFMCFILFLIFGFTSVFSFNYNWYYFQLHLTQFYQLSGKIQVVVNIFAFSFFTLRFAETAKSTRSQVSFFYICNRVIQDGIVGDRSRGLPESSLFNSYYIEV